MTRFSEMPKEWRRRSLPQAHSAKDLLAKDLPPVRWAVPGLVPEGVSFLAGKPKLGKSWLALGLCIAVASGGYALGTRKAEKGSALYLGLEDNERRLKSRIEKILAGGSCPEKLDYATEWPRLDEGGLEGLGAWLGDHEDARLIVIDTLAKIKPRTSGRRNAYDEDRDAVDPLAPLVARYGVAIQLVHHLRKMAAADPLDEISGTLGLVGGVDGALVLKRERGRADAYLHVSGREIEEDQELALRWDQNLASWSLAGDAEEYRQSEERQKILELLRRVDEPLGPKDVSSALGQSYGSVRVLLPEMVKDGLLHSPTRGKYTVNTVNTVNNTNIINSANAGQSPIVNATPVGSINNPGAEKALDRGISGDVNEVNDVAPELREFFEGAPEWLQSQLERCQQEERFVKPTCSSIAYEVYGTASRWEEVRPAVEQVLKGGAA